MAEIKCFRCAKRLPEAEDVCPGCYGKKEKEDEVVRQKSTEAFLYRENGSIDIVRPSNGKDFELGELQKLIGGMVELKPYMKRWWAVFDEEGTLKRLPLNEGASMRVGYQLYGPVLFTLKKCIQ